MSFNLENWENDLRMRFELRRRNIELLSKAEQLDDEQLERMDSSIKKLTSFVKRLKNINSPFQPEPYINDLAKLNVSKYLEEIASAVCEAKLKTSDLENCINFCVKVTTLYNTFPTILLNELKKHVPHKKNDRIEGVAKLRFDLRLLTELILNGILTGKESIQFFGNSIAFLVNTDKTEYTNVPILISLCRALLFDFSGILPLNICRENLSLPDGIKHGSEVLKKEQKAAISTILNDYLDSLLEHVNKIRTQMNRLQKSIKRQERTRGDAALEDRQSFDVAKSSFDRLIQDATALSQCLGKEMPQMEEELSDDERDVLEAQKIGADISEGKFNIWGDKDTQVFYEHLVDVTHFTLSPTNIASEDYKELDPIGKDYARKIMESVDDIDLSELEQPDSCATSDQDAVNKSDNANEEIPADPEDDDQVEGNFEETDESANPILTSTHSQQQISMTGFLAKLLNCINRELIDGAAIDFLLHLSDKKANRKRLVQHFLNVPVDRFDLLPFYARFLATIRPVLPELVLNVLHELINRFRTISDKILEPSNKIRLPEEPEKGLRINAKLHLCSYLSELAKFSILPKAEALSLLRSLLVNLRSFKVEMLCTMIESMGPYLYRSPESHAKMAIIMRVLGNKATTFVKDPKHKIVLENAYYAVIPPEEETMPNVRLPPVQEYMLRQISANEFRLGLFRRVNWRDKELAGFMIRLFSTPTRVRFDSLSKLASLVSSLSDYHSSIGIFVTDELLEFIRLALETNSPIFQQRLFTSIHYLGQLYNYSVCKTSTIMHILYQLITYLVPDLNNSPADSLFIRAQRIRMAAELVNVVGEFFCTPNSSNKRRMDNFLHFFLKFYYESLEKWPDFVDLLGDFPDDIQYSVIEFLSSWRKSEHFPKSLDEANKFVKEIESRYNTKVQEALSKIRDQTSSIQGNDRHLMCIAEEDGSDEEGQSGDDEYSLDENEHDQPTRIRRAGIQHTDKHLDTAEKDQLFSVRDDDEFIHVHIKERQDEPEDSDFVREFERTMTETMQSAPAKLSGPVQNLEVPPLARQKFERKITFAPEASRDDGENYHRSLSPATSKANNEHPAQPRMALMTRIKGGKGSRVVLKPVSLGHSAQMCNSWLQFKEAEERERTQMKRATLAAQERIQQQQQAELLEEANRRLNRVTT